MFLIHKDRTGQTLELYCLYPRFDWLEIEYFSATEEILSILAFNQDLLDRSESVVFSFTVYEPKSWVLEWTLSSKLVSMLPNFSPLLCSYSISSLNHKLRKPQGESSEYKMKYLLWKWVVSKSIEIAGYLLLGR